MATHRAARQTDEATCGRWLRDPCKWFEVVDVAEWPPMLIRRGRLKTWNLSLTSGYRRSGSEEGVGGLADRSGKD